MSETVQETRGKWFIVRTYSQHEKKVKEAIEQAVENLNLKDRIYQVVAPYEEIIEIRKNKKNTKKRPFFPGYVFVEMSGNAIEDKNVYWVIKNIAGVSGFLGGTTPTPLSDEEAKNMLEAIAAPASGKPKPAVSFEKGESVSIIDGPFKHFAGVVEEVNEEKGKLRIMVTIFGRQTPVELDFFQVEKM